MRKIVIITLATFLVLLSCKEEEDTTDYLTVTSGDTLRYYAGSLGDEEGAGVITEPKHAKYQELLRTTDFSGIEYLYVPKDNYEGTDFVVIETRRGSDGASENTDIETIELNIKIKS